MVENRLIGYLIASKKKCSYHIHKLMIEKEHRSMGIGRKLIEQFRTSLPNGSNITLKVSENNQKAIDFYKRHGFLSYQSESGYVSMESVK